MVMNPGIFYLTVGLETTCSQDLGWTLGSMKLRNELNVSDIKKQKGSPGSSSICITKKIQVRGGR